MGKQLVNFIICSCESTAPYLERTTDHGQATVKLYHLRLRVECTLGKQLVNFITCGCELSAPFQATGKLYHLRLRVECTLCVIYKAGREPTPYW